MRVLISWLSEYVDVPISIPELSERLSMAGLAVEAVEPFGDDFVLDIELTPNRPDCMSMLGIAREVSVLLDLPLRPPQVDLREEQEEASRYISVEILDPELCPRYIARVILDVEVGPSPPWMQRRLEAAGIRAINNVVDVTNYVMLELGQPLHAFDYDRLRGGRIIVRRAMEGETLLTLDGEVRSLDPSMLVIADAERPVALAGIIGGAETEIGPSTRRVLLEAAYFHPTSIRRTSKRLGLRTEASSRFERGMDPNGPVIASARACQLLQSVARGRVLAGAVDVYPLQVSPRRIRLRPERLKRLLGVEVPGEKIEQILEKLGCAVTRGESLEVIPPTFRPDLAIEEDLIEEVARIYGYNQIPAKMPVEATTQGRRDPVLEIEDTIREILVRCGFHEVHTYTLTNPQVFQRIRVPEGDALREVVRLRNPLVEDHTILRTTLVPGLLQVLSTNAARGTKDVHIFELGKTFHPLSGEVQERRELGLAMMGELTEGNWNLRPEQVQATFYHLKGAVETLFEELGVSGYQLRRGTRPWLHPGRSAELLLDGTVIAVLGEVHPEVARHYDLPLRAYLATVDIEAILPFVSLRRAYRPIPKFPAVYRDLAVVVEEEIPSGEVEKVIAEACGSLLERIELFDLYQGPPVPEGHKSLAYSLTFRAGDRTLSSEEVEELLARARQLLTQRLNAWIRGQ
ncbi:MAG: phenylalanine--tRNA ligase subunit beta [Armatimonadota bacterium]|nr:phenylalanine--tRNA ligase subunit beta [Armatimonadota bacterium]MDR5702698.1 phenylalanine--tRNA ligase subunit beta [Armatimonadota bacterium]